MSLTLLKALQTTPLREAKVVAGKSALDKQISAVNIIEVPEVGQWMKGGELLFSTGYAFGGDKDKGCEMIANLNSRGITALAIKTGKYLSEIPAEMVDYADSLNFPLLKLPDNQPYMYFMEPIYEILVNEKVAQLQQVAEFQENLLHAKMSGGPKKICEVFSALINRPAFILDKDGNIIVSSILGKSDAAGNDEYCENMQTAFYHLIRSGDCDKNLQTFQQTVLGQPTTIVCTPVYINSKVHSYLTVDAGLGALSVVSNAALSYTVTLVSLELLDEQALAKSEQQVRGELLDDLLRKNYDDVDLIYRRSRFVHFDLSKPFILFTVDVKPVETKQDGNDIHLLEEKTKNLTADLLKHIKLQIKSAKKSGMLLEKNSGVAGMFSATDLSDPAFIESALAESVSHFNKTYKNFKIYAGIGRLHNHIHEIPASYAEAKLAERVGSKLFPQNQAITFEELGVYRFLYDMKDSQTLLDFYHDNMDTLLECDQKSNGELIETLSCYFSNQGNLRKTAENLNIHKNSVIYRIKKIEGLLGKSLQDTDVSLNMQLCIKVMNILK